MADRFSEVIGKMQEETRKVEARKKAQKQNDEILEKYDEELSKSVKKEKTKSSKGRHSKSSRGNHAKEPNKKSVKDTKKEAKKVEVKIEEKPIKKVDVKVSAEKEIEKNIIEQKAEKKNEKKNEKRVGNRFKEDIKEEPKNKFEVDIEEELQEETRTARRRERHLIKEEEELEVIREELKGRRSLPKSKMRILYSDVFRNIMFAIIILLYFIFINIGYKMIRPDAFFTDLKVLSITNIIITICVFEYAYKKDSTKYIITGIELLVLSILTLLSMHTYTVNSKIFTSGLTSAALLFGVYYVGKSIVIYIKGKRAIRRSITHTIKE